MNRVHTVVVFSRWHPDGGDPQKRDWGGERSDGGVTSLVQPQLRHFQKLSHLELRGERVQAGEKVDKEITNDLFYNWPVSPARASILTID